jgi:hypothetical protein
MVTRPIPGKTKPGLICPFFVTHSGKDPHIRLFFGVSVTRRVKTGVKINLGFKAPGGS